MGARFGCLGDDPITCHDAHATLFGSAAQPRAAGRIALRTKPGPKRTVLADLHQSGAFKALFPRPRGSALEAILVNTAGGITGGDSFAAGFDVAAGTRLAVTTQAAERAYRAQPGEVGQVRNGAQVGPGARLDWLPQETILYDGCALDRALRIDLAQDARLLMVEPMVFGRKAMGEVLGHVHVRDRIEITREGAPLYTDAIRLWGDAVAHLARPAVAAGAGAMASLVFVAPEAEAHLAPLRALMPASGGVSLIGPDLLAMRLLAEDGHVLRGVLLPVLNRLTENNLPRSWTT